MSDLISRQAAIDGKILIQRANGVEIYTDEAVPVEYLKNVPAADVAPVVHSTWIEDGDPLMLTCGNCGYGVIPVVRCRDCKHLGTFRGKLYCRHNCGVVEPKEDDFCSYGERREE